MSVTEAQPLARVVVRFLCSKITGTVTNNGQRYPIRAGEMAPWVETLAAETRSPDSIHRIMKARIDFQKLSSESTIYIKAHELTNTHNNVRETYIVHFVRESI